ncbi:MAG: alpha/beta fold hydrolase [Candidatus Helarchaeota archaeon]
MPFIFVHGWTVDHFIWEKFIEYYKSYTEIWVLDLPGHGQSHCPHRDYSVSYLGNLLKKFIDHFAIKRPLLFGHSLGGFIILQYEIAFPGSSSGLICLSTTPHFMKVSPHLNPFLKPFVHLLLNHFFNMPLPIIRRFPTRITYLPCREGKGINCIDCEKFCSNKFILGNYLLKMLLDYDLRPYLSKIKVPVIVLVGTDDLMRFFLPSFQKIPDLTIKVIPHAPHDMIVSHTHILILLIEKFRKEKINYSD